MAENLSLFVANHVLHHRMSDTVRIGEYSVKLTPEYLLGSGAYASVYKGQGKQGPVAVKVVEFDSRPDQDKHYLVIPLLVSLLTVQNQEISIMEKIHHPNLLKLLAKQVCKLCTCTYTEENPIKVLLGGRILLWWGSKRVLGEAAQEEV